MSGFRNNIESMFSRFAEIIYDNKIKFLLLTVIMIISLLSQLKKITIDTSTEGFLHESDPALKTYYQFREQFGREDIIIVALENENVFDFEFLSALKDIHYKLEEKLPYLDDITSLINARDTYGEEDELIVGELFENWPSTRPDLERIKQRALSNSLYRNMLISEDSKITNIIIRAHSFKNESDTDELNDFDDFEESSREVTQDNKPKEFLSNKENHLMIKMVEEIVYSNLPDKSKAYIAGAPVVIDYIARTMLKDMRKFMLIAILIIMVFLFIMFKRFSGVFIPLIVVILSLLSTIGMMALTGTAIKLPTQILPSFLLAVGVGDSVHILAIFYRYFNLNENKREAIRYALGHSGFAVLMTSLTTAAGLLSFSTADIAPVADLGRFAAFGVMMALFYTIVLLPTLLAISPVKPSIKEQKKINRGHSKTDKILSFIADISVKHSGRVLIVSLLLFILSLIGIIRVFVSHYPLKWLPASSPARIANEKIDDALKGSTSLEVIIDTKKENGLYSPLILNKLEKLGKKYEKLKTPELSVGKSFSLTSVLKESNQALHGNNSKYYTIPDNQKLIAQEFLLFENSGSDDLEDFTDSQFSKARLTLRIPFLEALKYNRFVRSIENEVRSEFPEAEVETTGMVVLLSRIISSAITSMGKSYIYAMIIITILMIMLIGKIRIGLLSMIPNLIPILMTIAVMGYFKIPMDLFTMLVGSIAIGLAVDDTIHFMHNFRRYFEETKDPETAIRKTLDTTGRAMLTTSVVLCLGFFSFTFATMNNLFNFGILTSMAIFLALLADYFIAPSLLYFANSKKGENKQ